MHLRSVGVRPEFGVSLDDFRTVGRVELGCEHLMTISRQHIEFSVNNARNGSTTVRALHPNPIRVFLNGEAEGVLLSKLGTTTAKLRAGDLIEIGDVRGLIKDGQVFTFRLCSGTYQPATTTSPGRPAAAAAPPPAKRRCSTPVAAAAAAAAVPPDDSVPQEAAPLAPAAGAERETELAAAAPQHEVAAGVKPQGASIHTPMTLPGAANGAAISGGELATKQLTKPDYPSSAAQEPRRLSRDLREATESDPRVPAIGSQSASLSRNQPQSAAIESDPRVPLRQSAEAAAPSADAAAPSEEAEDVVVEDAAATSDAADAADAADAVDAATATMLRASAQRLRAEKGAKEVAEVAEAENVAEAKEVAEAAEAEEVEEAAEWEAEMAEVEAEDGVMDDDERAQHHYALSALFTSPPSSHLSALLAREQRRAAQAEAVIASVLAAAAEATAELEAQVAGSAKDDDAQVAMTMAIDVPQVAMTMAIDDAQVAMTDADVAADAAIVAADATVHVHTNEETAFAQEPVEGVLVDEAREEMVRTKPSDAVAGADADADVVAAAAAAAVEAAAASDADAQAAPSQAAPSQAAPSQAAPSQADAQAAMKAGAVAAAALESTSAWAMQDETPPLDLGSVHDERAVNDETSPLEFGKSWDDGPIALVATVRGYGVAAGLEGLQAHASPRAQRAAVSVADTLEPLLGNEPEDDERPPAARAHKHWNAALARAADLPHTASTRMPLQSPLPSFGYPSSAALVTTLWPANAFSCAVGGRVLSGPIATAIPAVVVSQHAVTPIVAPTSTADAQYGAHIGIGRKRAVEEPSAETSAESSAESSAEPSVFSTASVKAPRLLSGFRGSGERRGGA